MTALTLADYPARRNSLNALRLALAVLVIVSHSWPIGQLGPEPHLGAITVGTFAVAGFFAVSGWLITASRDAGGLAGFLWRRALRIYPGFLLALVAVGYWFAPTGALIAGTSWSARDAAEYVTVNAGLRVGSFTVGDTLPPAAYPAWNGSLWTLVHEAICYVVIGLVVTVAGRRWTPAVVLVLGVELTVAELVSVAAGLPQGGMLPEFLDLAPYFFAGAALHVLRARIPLHPAAGIGAAVALAVVIVLGVDPVLAAVPIAYLCLWLGASLPFDRVGRRTDISYGMYVYAFPVQQLLALAGVPAWGAPVYVLASVAMTVPFAAASWFLVEQPAQSLRHLLDRRPPADPSEQATDVILRVRPAPSPAA